MPRDGAKRTAGLIDRPVPLGQAAYQALLDLIISRELEPGRHLVEQELAELLGVSRQPVREALQRLNNEGWVDLRPGYGAFVHVPSESEADQLLSVRALLETESARLAARTAGDEAVARLWDLWRAGAEAVRTDDLDQVVSANADFHRTVTEVAGNQVLAELAAQVERRVRWYYAPVARIRGQASWDEHAKVIEAIARHDEDAAAELMRAHAERTRRTYHEEIDGAESEAS